MKWGPNGVRRWPCFLAACATLAVTSLTHAADPVPATQPVPAATYKWHNVPILGGGYVSGLLFHPTEPNLLYARTDIGGMYRWDETQRRWIPLTDLFGAPRWNYTGIESFAIDPIDPNRLYAAVGTYTNDWAGPGAILRSTNRGDTWDITPLPFKNGGNEGGRGSGERLAADPNLPTNILFGTRNIGLWQSADHGKTWSQSPTFPIKARTNGVGLNFVIIDPASGKPGSPSQTIYISVQDKTAPALYRSTDGGGTWSVIPPPPPPEYTDTSATNPALPNPLFAQRAKLTPDSKYLYITYANAEGPNGIATGRVLRLDTKSLEWTDITPEKPRQGNGFGYSGLAIDPKHPDTLLVSTICKWSTKDEVYRTTDAGKNWAPLLKFASKGADWESDAPYALLHSPHWTTDVALDPNNPDRAWFVTGYGVWATRNASAPDHGEKVRWSFDNHGLEECVILDLAAPPGGDAILLSSMYDQDGFRHTSVDAPPTTPMFQPYYGGSNALEYAELKPDVVVRLHQNGKVRLSLSVDNGKTWSELPSPPPTPSKGEKCRRPAIAADASVILWPQGDDIAYRTTDRGVSWAPVPTLPENASVTADKTEPARFYATIADKDAATVRVLQSTDAGQTFKEVSEISADQPIRLYAIPGKSGGLYATFSGGLQRSDDGGRTFNKRGTFSPMQIGLGKPAPGSAEPTLFANGVLNDEYGIYRSTDAGETWLRINDDRNQFAHLHVIVGDPRVFGRVFLGSGSRGVVVGTPTPTP